MHSRAGQSVRKQYTGVQKEARESRTAVCWTERQKQYTSVPLPPLKLLCARADVGLAHTESGRRGFNAWLPSAVSWVVLK